MGNRRLEYMEFKFKETPDKYLDDKELLLYNDLFDNKIDDVMEPYMESFFTQKEDWYEEYKLEFNDFMKFLNNHENQELVQEFKNKYISESPVEYNFDLDKTYMESTQMSLKEMKSKFKDKIPLYLIFNNSSHWFSKIITKISKGDFSHVGMSFKGPGEILSFSMGDKSDGMKVENMIELINDRSSEYIKIVAIPLDKKTYQNIYRVVHQMRLERSKYTYDLVSVITFPFRKAEEIVDWSWKNTSFFCSQFVSWVLGNAFDSIDTSHLTPVGLMNKVEEINNVVTIFEGSVNDFDPQIFSKFENSYRKTKDKLEDKAIRDIKKIKSKLKQESRLLSEVSSINEEKNMNTVYNILYNEFPDDSLNSNYHKAFNSLILDS